MKKAQFLIVATLVALAVLAASLPSLGDGKVGIGCSTVANFAEATGNTLLPDLSESVAPSQPSTSENQTDNSTAGVTSGGVVKASFTVVPRGADALGESSGPSTDNVAGDSNSTTVTDSAREANVLAVAQNNLSGTAAIVGTKSARLTMGWVLLVAIWSLVIAGTCTVALLLLMARHRLPSR